MGLVKLQSWMTGFFCIFAFIVITELYDTFLKDNLLKEESQQAQNAHSNRNSEWDDDDMECDAKPCIYEICCCGVLRRSCLHDDSGAHNENRKKKRCGLFTLITLTFVFGVIMEISHYHFFTNISKNFQPYFLEDESLTQDVRNKIWKLNVAKTIIFVTFFTCSIVLRASFLIVGSLVCIFLWPVILIYYCIAIGDERVKQQEDEEKDKEDARR